MPKIPLTKLNSTLTKEKFPPIYFLGGDDVFRKQEFVKKVISTIKPDEFNLNTFDAQADNLGELITLANTTPVFSNKRVIVLNNLDKLNKLKKSAVEALKKYFSAPLDSTCLIVLHNDLKKLKKDKTWQSALSEESIDCTFYNLEGDSLIAWITDKLKQNGLTATQDALPMFERLVGTNLIAINTEIEKLSLLLYEKQDKTITKEILLTSVGFSKEEDPFLLSTAILNLDKKEALRLVDSLLNVGETPISILNKISTSALKLFRIKYLSESGLSGYELSTSAGLLPWEKDILYSVNKMQSSTILLKTMDKIIEADIAFKTSKITSPSITLKGLINILLK